VYSVVGAIVYSALERIFSVNTGTKIQSDFINCFSSRSGALFEEVNKSTVSCEDTKLDKIKKYFKDKKGDVKKILPLVFMK